jgi:hypothetical protein
MFRAAGLTKSGFAAMLTPTHPLGKPDSIPPETFAYTMLPWMSHEVGGGVVMWTPQDEFELKMFATTFMPATPVPDGPLPEPPMTMPALPLFVETL